MTPFPITKNTTDMKTLYQAIERAGNSALSIKKHLTSVGITSWEHLTRAALYDLRDEMMETLAPSSVKMLLAKFSAILVRYEDEVELPKGWRDIFKVKGQKPLKTYLNERDLQRLEKVKPHTRKEEYILNVFLISAWTGARVSDAIRLTEENITEDGCISYVAKKTGRLSVVPMKPGLERRIAYVKEHPMDISLVGYNEGIRRLAQRAGITEEVVVVKGGVEKKGPKWMFISSHTARISTATCLARRGVGLSDIGAILGHSSVAMSERYVVPTTSQISQKALRFFM